MTKFENIRKVPSSIDSEKAVLGGLFIRPDMYSEVAEIIKVEDFYRNSYRIIFEAMRDLQIGNQNIDILLVMEKLKRMAKFEEIGGEKVLLEIIEDTPIAANILDYALIIKEKSTLRKLGEVATSIAEMVYDGYEEVSTILDKVESLIFKISENKQSKDIISLKEIIGEEFERLQKAADNKGVTNGISSGFKNYDFFTGGFNPSDLVILAARPAMGKTAFALNLALNAAMKSKKSILLFSLEMGKAQLLQRLISVEAGVPLQKIKNGFLADNEWGKLGLASARLADSEIRIADIPTLNVLEIRSMGRKLKAAGNLDMIIIDYLQLIAGTNPKSTAGRQQEVSEISRALKGIARELDIPIIALSQLSRAVENRNDRRPMLSDLRESGAIEQDADIVLFLYRDDYYNPESDEKGVTELIIGKQRNGPVGTAKLRFFPELTKFADYSDKVG